MRGEQNQPQACSRCSAEQGRKLQKGPQFRAIKIPYKFTCQFERFLCLDYGASTTMTDIKFRPGSAPIPRTPQGSLYTDPQLVLRGPLRSVKGAEREEERMGREGKGRTGDREGKGERIEVSWNGVADWARPALAVSDQTGHNLEYFLQSWSCAGSIHGLGWVGLARDFEIFDGLGWVGSKTMGAPHPISAY